MGYALTVLGITREDFDCMLPLEFQSCLDSYNRNCEGALHYDYEMQRFNAWVNLPTKQGTEPIDLVRFPWEKNEIKKVRILENGKTNTISKVKSST